MPGSWLNGCNKDRSAGAHTGPEVFVRDGYIVFAVTVQNSCQGPNTDSAVFMRAQNTNVVEILIRKGTH